MPLLKLKHLFHDRERALSILARWEHDPEQPNLMEQFRISANAIYPFGPKGARQFLRFAPAEEKSEQAIRAELEFLRYLNEQGYPALMPVPSKGGCELEIVDTPAGRYHAAVFQGVPGKTLDPEQMTDAQVYGWGRAMGQLHNLSEQYQPTIRRIDYRAQLAWMEDVLADFADEELARQEIALVRDWLSRLPQDGQSFGLIHYDFEPDNVFYDEASQTFYAIDFDDAVYHWYMMDVTTALHSYEVDAPAERAESGKAQFIAGYRSVRQLSDEWLARLPGFRRYQELYGYVRVIRSAAEQLSDEPDWMVGLRQHFAVLVETWRAQFGQPIGQSIE